MATTSNAASAHLIRQESMHIDEIDKMLRRPGQVAVSEETSKIAAD